jgi:hypothetical protein
MASTRNNDEWNKEETSMYLSLLCRNLYTALTALSNKLSRLLEIFVTAFCKKRFFMWRSKKNGTHNAPAPIGKLCQLKEGNLTT